MFLGKAVKLSCCAVPMVALGLSALCFTPAQALGVYSNDFEGGSTSGFDVNMITLAPNGSTSFLGQLGNQTATLSLSGLAAHSDATLSFDLYIIQSMDGNGPYGGGADPWLLKVSGGPTLLDTNFANYGGNTQSYPGTFTGDPGTSPQNTPGDGATAFDSLGYVYGGAYGDTTYHLSFTFPTTSSSLVFQFIGQQNQGIGDEGWGLDNITVSVTPITAPPPSGVPEPGTIALFATASLSGAGLLLRRRHTAK